MLGINDAHIARQRPSDLGHGIVGHELGDGRYVLERRPDLIVFHVGQEQPIFRSGRDLEQLPGFRAEYVPIRLLARSPVPHSAVVWLWKDGPKIGIRRTPTEIRVPGYLLTANPAVAASLDEHGTLVIVLDPTQETSAYVDGVPSGQWSISARALPQEAVATSLERKGAGLGITVCSTSAVPVAVEEIVLRADDKPPLRLPTAHRMIHRAPSPSAK
jgi:arabinofuranosyltransferase